MARLALRPSRALLAVVTAASASAGCVEPFRGSNIQLDFSTGTPVPSGTNPDGAHPPADTYFTFYAVDHVYQTDADGNVVLDPLDRPVIAESYLFEVLKFQIRPLIDRASPCYLDTDENNRFPGVHVTQVARKLRATLCDGYGLPEDCFDQFGLINPTGLIPEQASDGDITDVLTADRRMQLLPTLESTVKAVTSYSNFRYPAPSTGCDVSGDEIPAITCISDEANLQRLRACRALWESPEAAGYYEGSDKVFTLPLTGTFYGAVDGSNPINGGSLGGATAYVPTVVSDADAYVVNWQYQDYDNDGTPDYPDGFLDTHVASATGYTYMLGTPEQRVRGVINSRMPAVRDPNAYVEAALFSDLGVDDVNF